jgi:hypothetical protein
MEMSKKDDLVILSVSEISNFKLIKLLKMSIGFVFY